MQVGSFDVGGWGVRAVARDVSFCRRQTCKQGKRLGSEYVACFFVCVTVVSS